MAAESGEKGAFTMRVSPWVTHERLDDDVIAIHLETGIYYAFEGAAADCWSGAICGLPLDDLVRMLTGRYDVDDRTARRDAAEFVDTLVEERLVVVDADADGSGERELAGRNPAVDGQKRAYVTPVVQRYDDLDDLLMLDPIHEVDDAGWPIARGT